MDPPVGGPFNATLSVMTNIEKTLITISEERAECYSNSYAMAAAIVKEYGENDLANRLWADIPESSSLRDVADLYGILVWSTQDNGYEILKTTEKWIRDCQDYRKVHLSLHLDVYPFKTPQDMSEALEIVIKTFPNLKFVCKKLIESRGNDT
jgi:hypothetical protein